MMTLIEIMILRIVQSNPNWLNCSGVYVGEVLALQIKGGELIESRVIDSQLQVRIKMDSEVYV